MVVGAKLPGSSAAGQFREDLPMTPYVPPHDELPGRGAGCESGTRFDRRPFGAGADDNGTPTDSVMNV